MAPLRSVLGRVRFAFGMDTIDRGGYGVYPPGIPGEQRDERGSLTRTCPQNLAHSRLFDDEHRTGGNLSRA